MNKVYKITNSASSIFYTSLIASSIKLIDLLLPIRIDKVINPAVSIILECIPLIVIIIINDYKLTFNNLLFISIAYRFLYSIYILLMPEAFLNQSVLCSFNTYL
jgi:hypothetical protein